MFSKI